jgi:N-methylhydantoinase A
VTVALDDLAAWPGLRGRFDEAHQRAYGYAAPDVEVQLLNLRLAVVFPLERPRLPTLARRGGDALPFETRKIYSTVAQDTLEYRVVQRAELLAGDRVEGPAVVDEAGTTTIVEPTDVLTVEMHGCLMIEVGRGATA